MRSYLVRDRLRHFAFAKKHRPLEIVSYDVPGHDNRTAVAIAHFMFGRTTRSSANGVAKEYRYPGLIEKDGVVWLGQSVFLLTPERSSELQQFLGSRGVAFGRISVHVD
ncbi:MAG: hypothetical protein ACREDF_10235 [Thermoplasmata archaeon]